MSVQAPLDPQVGSPFSITQFRERVLNPLHQSDLSLEQRIAAIESALAGLPAEFTTATIPAAARYGDHWYDTTEPTHPIFRICKLTYTEGGTIEANWRQVKDPRAHDTATSAAATAASAANVTVDGTPPTAAKIGWVWVDNSLAGMNKVYTCRTNYNEGELILPANDPENSQWEIASDNEAAQSLAEIVAGLKDNKTGTFFGPTVPVAADARDGWAKEIDAYTTAGYVLKFSYIESDGDPWADSVEYAPGRFASVGLAYYRALTTNTNKAPASNPGDWALYTDTQVNPPTETFASKTIFKESLWRPSADVIAREYADDARTIAAGKSQNYYQPDMPNPLAGYFIEANDLWINQATRSGKVCILRYGHDGGAVETNWQDLTVEEIQAQLDAVSLVANGKTANRYGAVAPAEAGPGDIWVDNNDNNTLLVNKFPYPYVSTSGAEHAAHSYPEGSIVTKTGVFYRASAAAAGTDVPPAAPWVSVGTQSIGNWSIGQSYVAGVHKINGGRIWRALRDHVSAAENEPSIDTGIYWGNESVTATSEEIFRVQAWELTRDAASKREANVAQQTADGAQAIADGKAESFIMDVVPPYAAHGDIWTDTRVDPLLPVGAFRQWKCKAENGYDYRPAAYGGVFEDDWTEHYDAAARKLAEDTRALVDKKRTTFVTENYAEPLTTKWPGGSAEVAGHIVISYWADLPADSQGNIAQVGDIWINKYNGVSYIRHCVTAYAGDIDDPGSADNWASFAAEGSVTAAVAAVSDAAYHRDGSKPLTAPIVFKDGSDQRFAAQDFLGRDLDLTGSGLIGANLRLRYGVAGSGTPGNPTNADHAVHISFLSTVVAGVNSAWGAADAGMLSTINTEIATRSAADAGLTSSIGTVSGTLSTHTGSTSNPHGTTLAQAASAQGTTNWTTSAVITATGFTVSSERDLKRNIFALTGAYADEVVAGLTPVEFEYKSNPGKKRYGFIFEDSPKATQGDGGMDLSHIVAMLVDVVKRRVLNR